MNFSVIDKFETIPTDVRKECEGLFDKYKQQLRDDYKKYSSYEYHKMYGYYSSYSRFTDIIKEEIIEIADKNNVDKDLLIFWLGLDRRISTILGATNFDKNKYTLEKIKFSNCSFTSFYLNGYDIVRMFDTNYDETLLILQQYTEHFPSTTQKYIKNKIKQNNNESKLNKISNVFEYKIFCSHLPEKIVKTKLKDMFRKFLKINDKNDMISSCFYFLLALNEKYPDTDLSKLYDEFNKPLFNNLNNCLLPSNNNNIDYNKVFSLGKKLFNSKNNPCLTKSFLKKVSKDDNFDAIIVLLNNCDLNDNDLELFEDSKERFMYLKTNFVSFMDFKLFSKKEKEDLYNMYENQFFEHFNIKLGE